jgi:hypothetical protein
MNETCRSMMYIGLVFLKFGPDRSPAILSACFGVVTEYSNRNTSGQTQCHG